MNNYNEPLLCLLVFIYKGNVWAAGGEEPTGAPIILHQHRMKKASISEVIPEIFLRDAATSSRTQPEPKIMRKLLARIGFSRQSRSRSQVNFTISISP